MYSVVLMAAMMTTPETPDFGRRGGGGCCGQSSCGCYGETACGCHGGHGGRKHRGHGGGGGCCGVQSCGCCGVQAAPSCGCYGGGGMMYPGATPSPAPMPSPGPAKTAANPNAATIVVTGAQGANVLIGGLVSAGGTDTRTLESPELEPGQVYHYDLTAETVRDGQTVRLTQAVTVKPGETTEVHLDFAAGEVVMK